MGLSCGAQCAKFILFGFNIIFWLSGVALIVAGTYVAVSKDLSVLDGFLESGDNQLKYVAFALIGIGVFVFIVGFCGCCGAVKENRCLLGMYIFLLVLVLVIELAIGIFAALKKDQLEKAITSGARKNMMETYPAGNATEGEGSNYKRAMDELQIKGMCCGMSGSDDWKESKWKKDPKTKRDYMVPSSCCGRYKYDDFYVKCNREEKYYRKGCTEYIKNTIKSNAPIIIGVGCGIAALEIFGLIFAICLCRSIGHTEYDA